MHTRVVDSVTFVIVLAGPSGNLPFFVAAELQILEFFVDLVHTLL